MISAPVTCSVGLINERRVVWSCDRVAHLIESKLPVVSRVNGYLLELLRKCQPRAVVIEMNSEGAAPSASVDD